MKKLSIVSLIASSFLLLAAPALADETAPAKKETKVAAPAAAAAPAPAATPAKDVKDAKSSKDYGYAFEDDPLQSGVAGTTGFVLKVRAKGAREVLLKPRTSFVPEMLKSVEAM